MFIAYLHQPGGCDYTIGCGNELIELHSKTLEEAKKELSVLIKEAYTGDMSLDEVRLFSAEEIEVDINSVYNELEEEKTEFEQSEKDEKDKVEYERLKKKFG